MVIFRSENLVAQETRIIWKLFIFNFYIKKFVLLELVVIINDS